MSLAAAFWTDCTVAAQNLLQLFQFCQTRGTSFVLVRLHCVCHSVLSPLVGMIMDGGNVM